MTSSSIDRMEAPESRQAGRELDAIIAENVFGFKWVGCLFQNPQGYSVAIRRLSDGLLHSDSPLRPYSTSIADAWLVVEKMESLGWDARLDRTHDGHAARFTDEYGTSHHAAVDPRDGGMPLAICLAARAALASTQSDTPPTEGQPT